MANSDYTQAGSAGFATFVKTDVTYEHLDTNITYTEFNFAVEDAIQPGMAAMWDDEICSVTAVTGLGFTLKRGCADTVPMRHLPGSIIWIIDTGSVGSDGVERSADSTVAVKIAPFTIGGGTLPVANAPPVEVHFNWRYFRPYNAAYLFANGMRWYSTAILDETTGGVNLTWRDRNRITQADQLLGHDDATMAPEPGTTYTMRMYSGTGTLLREEPGIVGNAFLYQYAKARYDIGPQTGTWLGSISFTCERDRIESLQDYFTPIQIEPTSAPIPSQWQAFAQRAMASPYILNARKGAAQGGVMFGVRPADRMSDVFNAYRHWIEQVDTGEVDEEENPIYESVVRNDLLGTSHYTPWLSTDFRLPELETTFNVRSSSLYDGVRVGDDAVGKLALIDDELVVIKSFNADGSLTLGRGVGDTIPAVHIAGSRMYIFESNCVMDGVARSGMQDYRLQPGVFGTAVDVNSLPALMAVTEGRAAAPYNVGQIAVAGRPWFEEAQAVNGAPLGFLWAWRNRVTQGATAYDTAYPSIDPEAGTVARLTFYYETPAVLPGAQPTRHDLRTALVNPVAGEDGEYFYPYSLALIDGDTAGRALAICGTVVIYCRIECVRAGLASTQAYIVPIRVPSYPCT